MTTDEFLDSAIAERDAAIERRVREEIAAEIDAHASTIPPLSRIPYRRAARIVRGGAA